MAKSRHASRPAASPASFAHNEPSPSTALAPRDGFAWWFWPLACIVCAGLGYGGGKFWRPVGASTAPTTSHSRQIYREASSQAPASVQANPNHSSHTPATASTAPVDRQAKLDALLREIRESTHYGHSELSVNQDLRVKLGRWLTGATTEELAALVKLDPATMTDGLMFQADVVPVLMSEWARRDGPAALEASLHLPDDARLASWSELFVAWAAHDDPAEVLAAAKALHGRMAGENPDLSSERILVEWFERTPGAALEWMARAANSQNEFDRSAVRLAQPGILERVLEAGGPDEAWAWAETWAQTDQRAKLRLQIIAQLEEKDAAKALEFFDRVDWREFESSEAEEEAGYVFYPLIGKKLLTDEAGVLRLLPSLPLNFQVKAAEVIADAWVEAGRWRELARWADTLPASHRFDPIHDKVVLKAVAENDWRTASHHAIRSAPAPERLLHAWFEADPARADWLLARLLEAQAEGKTQ